MANVLAVRAEAWPSVRRVKPSAPRATVPLRSLSTLLVSRPMNTCPLVGLCAVLGSLVIGGCGGGPNVIDAKSAHDSGRGTVRVYDASYDQTWAAVHAAIKWEQVGAPHDHPDEHYRDRFSPVTIKSASAMP